MSILSQIVHGTGRSGRIGRCVCCHGNYASYDLLLVGVKHLRPSYGLITADLDITGMVDYKLMRRHSMTAVRTILQLASTSTSELKASTAG